MSDDDFPRFKLTIKNYRCFDRSQPAEVELGPGFTAFVGPNNSGKSTLLRMFYELRNIFEQFRPRPGRPVDILRQGWHASLLGLADPHEAFPFSNSDEVAVELDLLEAKTSEYRGVELKCARTSQWHGTLRTDNGSLSGANAAWRNNTLEVSSTQSFEQARLLNMMAALANALYVGPFRNAINRGEAGYYDLQIGTGFVKLWDNWKNGDTKAHNVATYEITEDIRRIFELKRLEINVSPSKETLKVVVDDRPYDLRELGAGLAQFIVAFGCAAIKRPSVILIDEPELNLHPSLQVDFLTSLAKYSQHGAVWFATHSMGLARSVADRIYSVQKRGDISAVRDCEATSDYAEFVGEMSFSAYRELGFERILLVEGPTDVRAVQQWLRLYKKDHKIVLIHLGGSSSINAKSAQQLSEIKRLSDKISVLIDSERTGPGAPLEEGRHKFLANCRALGIEAHATERRALENYLADSAVKTVKGPKYRALEPYEVLRNADPAWAKHENWRIAAAMTLAELEKTDLHPFLRAL